MPLSKCVVQFQSWKHPLIQSGTSHGQFVHSSECLPTKSLHTNTVLTLHNNPFTVKSLSGSLSACLPAHLHPSVFALVLLFHTSAQILCTQWLIKHTQPKIKYAWASVSQLRISADKLSTCIFSGLITIEVTWQNQFTKQAKGKYLCFCSLLYEVLSLFLQMRTGWHV